MKRFFTLDWLRGIAIITMVGFHTIEILAGDSNLLNFIFNQPLLVQILLSPFLILMSWRSFFLIISTIGLTYSLQKRYEKIDNERIDNSSKLKLNFKVMLQHCLVGFILFLHALIIQIFWNPYSTIAQWAYTGVLDLSSHLYYLYFSDAIGNIALSVIIVSIVCFILMSYKGFIKAKRNILIFGLLALLVFLVTPVLEKFVLDKYGYLPISIQSLRPDTISGNIHVIFWAYVIGHQQPLFPYLADSFIGCIIGIVLSQKSLSKKKTLGGLYLFGVGLIIVGLVLWIVTGFDMSFMSGFMIPPTWFLIVINGLMVIIITFCLNIFEFGKRLKSNSRFGLVFRRFGQIALTIYTLQILDIVPKIIIGKIIDQNLLGFSVISDVPLALFVSFMSIIWWIVIAWFWEKINFTLSFEWFLTLFKLILEHKKINWKDPLNINDTLRNVEHIKFVNS